jgi:hypothetical protein
MLTLRPYQEEAVASVYEHLRTRDDNPCVVIPTGGGKTPVMATICRDAVKNWQGRVLILAHVKELLEQSAEKLQQVCPEVKFGIYSAGLKKRETKAPVIVAGIQSIYKRACELGPVDLILVDEAHMIAVEGEGMYRQFLADARVVCPHLRIVGFTATPFRLKSGLICTPDHFLNHVCYEVGVRELIVHGYLSPLITKAGRDKVDTSNLQVRGGEFVAGLLESLMDEPQLVEAACRETMQHAGDRKSVLIFASGVRHGQHVVETLKKQHGVECGFVTGETLTTARDLLLERFKSGELRFLCNVNVLTTGFDAPNVDCVVLLRPTMSPGLYYQMCLDMETEVLTTSGWRRCHEVAVGDMVAAFDAATEEIVYRPAVDKVHRPLKPTESMYGLAAPHLDLRVTDQHTMVVRGRAQTCLHWQFQTAASVAERRDAFTIPIAGRGTSHHSEASISDAEVEFIGWFLTDGYLNRANNTVTISQSTAKFAAEVRAVLMGCNFGFREYEVVRTGKESEYADGLQFVIAQGEGRGVNSGLAGWNRLEQWLDKDIPKIFNTLSRRQFSILLDAMNLANGRTHVPRDHIRRVMQISVGCRQRMADRLQQLAIERGFRCNVVRSVNKPNAWNQSPQPQWIIYVKRQRIAYIGGTQQYSNILIPNRSRLGPVDFQSNEWVWCLTTEQGTLVTRRNGKVAIVGNCGRGFRIAPDKQNCLVLDFGGNVLRHGPVDAIQIEKRELGGGEAPLKECPICQSMILAGYATCPHCGYTFSPPEKQKHEAKATDAGILSGQANDDRYEVHDIFYRVHKKKDGGPDAPKTMRVDYQLGLNHWQSEFICFEHTGFARQKAEAWWQQRSPDPVPDTAEAAVTLANAGALKVTHAITVRSVAGERFDRIVKYDLRDMPEDPSAEVVAAAFSDDETPF